MIIKYKCKMCGSKDLSKYHYWFIKEQNGAWTQMSCNHGKNIEHDIIRRHQHLRAHEGIRELSK